MKIVYITGCLGFMGSYVTRECLKRGYFVKGVDKMTYAANESLLTEFYEYPNFSFMKTDINDIKFLHECDYVINMAAETHVGNSIVSSDDFVKSNINGVHHLLELLRSHRQEGGILPILLHFSTDEVYGDIESGAHTETDILKPSNPYSATKAAGDMLIKAWARTYGLKYIIVRPTNNYGIGQYIEKLLPKAVKYLSVDKKIPLHNNGEPVRTWLHAQDTAMAIMKIIDSGVVNEIYNISGDEEYKNIDVCKTIISIFRGDDGTKNNEYDQYFDFSVHRAGQDVRYALDDSKLRALGWKPEQKFSNNIRGIVNYYKEHFIW